MRETIVFQWFHSILLIFNVPHFIPHLLYPIPLLPTIVKHGEKVGVGKIGYKKGPTTCRAFYMITPSRFYGVWLFNFY